MDRDRPYNVILPSRTLGNLLVFSQPHAPQELRSVLAIAWHFRDLGGETWTHRLNQFKAGRPSAIQGAINVVSLALMGIDWRGRKIGLAAAPPSNERSLRPNSPLSLLGEGVARWTGMRWLPSILRRERRGFLRLLANARGWPEESEMQYECLGIDNLTTLIVLADLADRGESLGEIVRAIRATNAKTEVFGFALGRTETWREARQWGYSLNNAHIPAAWGRVWDAAKSAKLIRPPALAPLSGVPVNSAARLGGRAS